MSPQFAAGLTAFVGLCLVAGWATGFRNRSYVGWLGLAFLLLAGSLMSAAKAGEARELGADAPALGLLAKVLFGACFVAFLLAALAAVRETARRLQELRLHHEEAAEAMLEIFRASQARERAESAEGEPGGERSSEGQGEPGRERSSEDEGGGDRPPG
jgi:hypothetical protein